MSKNHQNDKSVDKTVLDLIEAGRILGITENSSEVKPGYLFVAIKGKSFNGEDFIEDAIQKGAGFILCYRENAEISENSLGVTFIKVPNPRQYMAFISAAFYRDIPKNISTVTGTNGKTSVVNFANQIVWLLNENAASIGTLGILQHDLKYKESMTTLPAVELHKVLESLKKEYIENVFMESSSQGLDQYRTDYIPLKCACITNIRSDHIDYHKERENYIAAKMRLFKELVHDNYVIHKSALGFFEEKDLLERNYYVYGYGDFCNNASFCGMKAYVQIVENSERGDLLPIKIQIDGKVFDAKTQIHCMFQLENLLAAVLMVSYHGFSFYDIISVLPKVKNIPGRCDLVTTVNGGSVFIDFAHNPDGLRVILSDLKKLKKKIITVFGCGGDRDKEKRPEMARITEEYSEHVIVTDDNPRFESPEVIRGEILKGFSDEFINIYEIADRKTAIWTGMSMLDEDSVLLIAGKGIEDYKIIGDTKYYYSDYESVEEYQKAYQDFSDAFVPFSKNIKRNFSLKNISRIHVGGRIKSMFVPESFEELKKVLSNLSPKERVIVFGGCSNLLISDFSIDVFGIKLSKLNKVYFSEDESTIVAESGAFCEYLARFAELNSIAGFEFLNGIPGTIGGGIFMNAGCFGSDFSKILEKFEVLDTTDNSVKIVEDLSRFEYRNANIQYNFVILRGFFKALKGDKEAITNKKNEILEKKWMNQPKEMTCGSTFKNPPADSAWRLVKASMPENFSIGGVRISERHANFLISSQDATFKDFIQMISVIRKNVLKRFGILLELEIRIVL